MRAKKIIDSAVKKVSINKPGGTAGKTSYEFAIRLPMGWMKEMGVSKEDRELKLEFDGERIILTKERRNEE